MSTEIVAPRAWRLRVLNQRLAIVDGLLTLDAQRLEGAPNGIDLYAAAWIEQGRGYDLRAVHGYIAIGHEHSYHADSVEGALAGIKRKAGLTKANAALVAMLAQHNIERVMQQSPELDVRVSDARATGSCEYGIKSWCNRTGLDYAAGSAPLGQVYRAYQQQPLPEARAAILYALRRQRKAVLKTA